MTALLADAHFIRPGCLLLAIPAMALWWLWRRRTDPLHGWRGQLEPRFLQALVISRQGKDWHPTLLLVFWLLTVLAIAGPTWRRMPSPFADSAEPLMILLKADATMTGPGPSPSPLERARLKIHDLAEARRGQPLGLIAYAGSAHLVLPPTHDTAVVARMADEITPAIMPEPGDRLDLALGESLRTLEGQEPQGSILILADSVNADPDRLKAAEFPLPIQFLAINVAGSDQDRKLRDTARNLGAKVVPIDTTDSDITTIIRRTAHQPRVAHGDPISDRWQDLGYRLVPILAAVLLLLLRREQGDGEEGT